MIVLKHLKLISAKISKSMIFLIYLFLIAANLIDSHNGYFDNGYSYQGRDHQPQFTVSAINDNSLALFRLLNFIDQSVPEASMPFEAQMPFHQNSKTSISRIPSTILNNNYSINKRNTLNNRHQTLASQSSSASTPTNYNWPRKRDQNYWRQQHQNQNLNQHQSQSQSQNQNHNQHQQQQQHHHHHQNHNNQHQQQLDSQAKQPQQVQLVDNANSIELQPPVSKLLKSFSSTSSNSKVPHDADSELINANNAPRCDKFTPDICVDDFEYPEQAIIDEIQKKRDVFELMYSEVKDNEPLVDGIPRDVEESYNYDYYYYGKANLSQAASQMRLSSTAAPLSASASNHLALASQAANTPSSIDGMDALIGAITSHATSPTAITQSPPTTGFICPSEVMYGKPKLAKNKKGLWKVIVNAGEFTQTVRLEKCLLPNKRCNYVSQSYESRCAQVHSHHRLLVFEKGRGFYIDTFRLPTGCNCHVTKKNLVRAVSASGEHRAVAESSLPDKEIEPGSRLSNQMSQTLWSILGGGGASMTQRSASQSATLDHLSKNPQLAANISDSVLRQLIDGDQQHVFTHVAGHQFGNMCGAPACKCK